MLERIHRSIIKRISEQIGLKEILGRSLGNLKTLKRKAIVYSENYLPAIGGLENNTLLLCESLHSLGFLVTLITPQKNALKHTAFNVIESTHFKTFLTEMMNHDFLIVNGGVSFKIIIPALIARKPFTIIYQMATLFNDIRSDDLATRTLNLTRKTLAMLAVKNLGVSEFSFLQLEETFGKKKTGLLINPADPIFTKQSDSPKDSQILHCLFAGRLIEGKGIRLLINAIREINKDKEIIHLHVIGDGPEKQYVLDQKPTNYIFYHPPVLKAELGKWLSKVHLTVIPSTSHIEGSPLIMAESLIMDVPVLVSSQPAMTESVKHKSLIFESGNLQDLIHKLSSLANFHNYQIVKDHCRKISAQYSYQNYLKQLKCILDA